MNFQHEHSEQMGELFGALAKAQGSMNGAAKDAKNPFYKSTYADLSSVAEAAREALSAQGLAVLQTVRTNEASEMFLVTTLGHASGQWFKSVIPIKVKQNEKKNDMQELGSVLTYLRRYALASITGVVPVEPDDDDGNKGGQTTAYANPTKAQIEVLNMILNECDPKYISLVNEHMANKKKSFGTLTFEEYEKLLKTATTNREEFKKKGSQP